MHIHAAQSRGKDIQNALKSIQAAPMLPTPILRASAHRFDFSARNISVEQVDMTKHGALQAYIGATLAAHKKTWGWGGYSEERSWYISPLFTAAGEPRTVHLGIDVWLLADTPIYAPIKGVVHSFQNNQNFLDYGPTIIIEHKISGTHFFTLYGHLSVDSLQHLTAGSAIPAGGEVGRVGEEFENGSWAPHLHFQIIGDMLGKSGDFPGVAKRSEKDFYLALCPNPELLFFV